MSTEGREDTLGWKLWSAGRILMGRSCRKCVGWLSSSYRPGSLIKLAERDLHLLKIFYFPREKDKVPAISVSSLETKRARAVKKSSVSMGVTQQGSRRCCHEVPTAHEWAQGRCLCLTLFLKVDF